MPLSTINANTMTTQYDPICLGDDVHYKPLPWQPRIALRSPYSPPPSSFVRPPLWRDSISDAAEKGDNGGKKYSGRGKWKSFKYKVVRHAPSSIQPLRDLSIYLSIHLDISRYFNRNVQIYLSIYLSIYLDDISIDISRGYIYRYI